MSASWSPECPWRLLLPLAWLFRENAATALIDAGRGLSYSFDELRASSRSLAGLLADFAHLAAGDRVALLAHNRLATFELLFACAHLHATLVPLNWRLSERELATIVNDCAPRALFHDRHHAHLAKQLAGDIALTCDLDGSPTGDARPGMSYEQARAYRPNERTAGAEASGALLEDPAMLLYTSGTTGAPKGVMLSWRQVAHNARTTGALCQFGPNDRTLVFLPLFHTGGINCLATPILAAGGTVVVMAEFDATAALDAMERYDITAVIGVPTIYERLLAAGIGERSLPHLRWRLMGGAPATPGLLAAYRDIDHPLNQGYGLTEVGPNCFTVGIDAPDGSVGVPVPGTEARLRTTEGDIVTGPGAGELCLRGPHVTLGYWRKPAETAAVLHSDGWFHTGDIARRDAQGWYYIVGRKKDMYISGGENVYPAEIECLLAEHPLIVEAAVIGVSDESWGEVGLAIVSLRAGADAALHASSEQSGHGPEQALNMNERVARTLRPWLRERLAAYKVPKRWRVVSELPKTPTGKIAKAVLVERFT